MKYKDFNDYYIINNLLTDSGKPKGNSGCLTVFVIMGIMIFIIIMLL